MITLLEIPSRNGIDSIRVYWHNVGVGSGYVTLTCFGCAWNAYFGAMNGDSIEDFFRRADTPYLGTKLGGTRWLKSTKKHDAYLAKLINAVKAELADNPVVDEIAETRKGFENGA